MSTRTEKDSLGELEVPDDAYYGIQTLRAVQNYPISGITPRPAFIDASIYIKKAAAMVHKELGLLDAKVADAIVNAADEVLAGQLREQFVVDVYQAGAGTSHHMNVNEVLANRANELLGGQRGQYTPVNPNDHVNMAQSTNDVIPTAIRISSLLLLGSLYPVLDDLTAAFAKKAKDFDKVIKSGRTHLQDAVPMRLGQEFGAYALCVERHTQRIRSCSEHLEQLGIGGSAAGTGLNVHPKYRQHMPQVLSQLTGLNLKPSTDYFEAMQSMAPFSALSAALRNLALDINRIANDLRLLSSGPTTGLAEISLPSVQPGSSIMPGKVNPSIAEMVNQVCIQVMGFDHSIAMGAQSGQLELNFTMPLIAFNLTFTLEILTNCLDVFSKRCVQGIEANVENCKEFAEKSITVVTAFNPYIGYAKAAEVSKLALKEKRKIGDIIAEQGLLDEATIKEVLDLEKLTEPGIPGKN